MAEQDEPLANFDPWVEGGGVHGFIGKPIARYDIIFDDEEQLKRWYRFIKGLRSVYPNERTIGGRVNQFLLAHEAGKTIAGLLSTTPQKKSTKKSRTHGGANTHGTHAPTPTGEDEG